MNKKEFNKKWRNNPQYYNSDILRNTLDDNGHNIDIALVYSGRNRGKSFDISSRALERAWESGGSEQFGYVRRLEKEIKLSNIEKYFDDKLDFIKDLTDNQADSIAALSDGIYFSKLTQDGNKMKKVPLFKIGDYFSLSSSNQYKSLQYPKITCLIFEEVFTTDRYLPNEVTDLLNLISTIKRSRSNFTCFMISNTVSRVNPYTKGLALKGMLKQKSGTIDSYRLYKGTFDELGQEEYYYIVTEYLQDTSNEQRKSLLDLKRDRVTTVSSNKWQELNTYVNASNYLISKYFTENKVVFEFDNDMFLTTICTVPYNIEDIIADTEVKEDNKTFTCLFVERKTSDIKRDTRVYTNRARVNPYCTLKFKRTYPIDDIIQACISKGYIIYSDNLTGNEFNQILKELY